ncbi:MAG: hypothetical protein HY011_07150 [Acidobacteria bacterium]|nr:hypothetical protein [Acidobacteriota bacterium]
MPESHSISNQGPNSVLKGSRSTALKPIIWMTGILAPTTVVAIFLQLFLGVPKWTSIFFCTATGLSVLLYVVAYLYFMINDQNALRSEEYLLEKLPIERTTIGDIHIQLQPEQQPPQLRETTDPLLERRVKTPLSITERTVPLE